MRSVRCWKSFPAVRLVGCARTAAAALVIGGIAAAGAAATVTVSDAGDSSNPCATTGTGTCTLRDAITFANAHSGFTIAFDIAGSGVHTITPTTDYPAIVAPVTIDGFTQPGSKANTNGPGLGDNSTHFIEIDGSNTSPASGAACLVFSFGSGPSTVKGLVVNRCKSDGISMVSTNGGNTIQGNFIGTDPTGTITRANGDSGIFLNTVSTTLHENNDLVGGPAPAARNLLSGNLIEGVNVAAGTGHLVENNLIGTNAAGTAALGNGTGIGINCSDSTFGGTTASARNVISGNTGRGILMSNSLGNPAVTNNVVEGNFIGTDVTGTLAIANDDPGIGLYGFGNTIGGTTPGAGNVISGNSFEGIDIQGADGSVIQGNFIGTDAGGSLALGNAYPGITLSGSGVTIGGTDPAAANVIAFNGTSFAGGVIVSSGTGNEIRGNSIFSNKGLGIDLGGDGVTLNDPGDADTGANNLQNFPIITSVSPTNVQGTLNSTANTSFTLEFFANPDCSASGYGQGKTLLGSKIVTTDGSGNVGFNAALSVPGGTVVTATATDPSGNTSEFSQCGFLFPAALVVDPSSDAGSDGDGVLEPGETVAVQPSWKNPTAAPAMNVTGDASSFNGPGSGFYVLEDATANYGNVQANTIGSCTGCYSMFVSAPASRPVPHWDASFMETLHVPGLPDTMKNWKLHVGDSFTDVSRSYLFYTKIETVFHNAITVGCTTTQYCPTDKVPRSQMSIFIGRGIAKGGANVPVSGTVGGKPYNCVAGGTSLFTDVAPTDIFCKSVHYIDAQHVTSGCAASLYCPGDLVTRSQMGIFIAKAIVAPNGGSAVPLTYGPDPGTGLSYSCDPASPNLHFTDVSVSDVFCKHVHFLWAKGVIAGCSGTQYCPDGDVGRDEMAKFLANAFGLILYGP